jgi:hypothetical protein
MAQPDGHDGRPAAEREAPSSRPVGASRPFRCPAQDAPVITCHTARVRHRRRGADWLHRPHSQDQAEDHDSDVLVWVELGCWPGLQVLPRQRVANK